MVESIATTAPGRQPSLAPDDADPGAVQAPETHPVIQGTFKAIPRREVSATFDPATGSSHYEIRVVNGGVLRVPPDGWLA